MATSQTKYPFTRIPQFILKWRSLTAADKIVYMALLFVCDYGKNIARPSKGYVARLTGLSERQVNFSVRHMLTARLITETDSKWRTRAYIITPFSTVLNYMRLHPKMTSAGWRRVFSHRKEFPKCGRVHTKLILALRRICNSGEYFDEFFPSERKGHIELW